MTATSPTTMLPELPGRPDAAGRLIALDGLRAIAVAMVLSHHLLPLDQVFGSRRDVPPLGFIGVTLFFVLSGFLITRILLAARMRIDAGEATARGQAWRFYARRSLRIFPVYYATLGVLWLLDVRHIRDRFVWHVTYTNNWYFSHEPNYRGGFERHFWTLAVEEQFYLLWPWLILLTPTRMLAPLVGVAFLIGPAWRAWFALRVGPDGQTWPWTWSTFPTPACADLLAAGGILALAWGTRLRKPLLWTCLTLGVPATVAAMRFHGTDTLLDVRRIVEPTAWALLFTAAVGFATGGIPYLGRALSWRPMVYVGTISYAVYVFHNFTPEVLRQTMPGVWDTRPWALGIASILVTFAAASASWHLAEKPINRLKTRIG